jgi:hypothetical protein
VEFDGDVFDAVLALILTPLLLRSFQTLSPTLFLGCGAARPPGDGVAGRSRRLPTQIS